VGLSGFTVNLLIVALQENYTNAIKFYILSLHHNQNPTTVVDYNIIEKYRIY
jgi:hypothetical protein